MTNAEPVNPEWQVTQGLFYRERIIVAFHHIGKDSQFQNLFP